ncbi:MAG: DNA recombination protein RmuC [Gammaproteobacteria bacterium]
MLLAFLFQRRTTVIHHLLLRYDERFRQWDDTFNKQANNSQAQEARIIEKINGTREQLSESLSLQRSQLDKQQVLYLQQLLESMQKGFSELQQQVTYTLRNHSEMLTAQVKILTKDTNTHLKDISGQVEKRLSEGFEKTTAIFTDMVKRIAIIDEAQKKISELSGNVVSLQEILSDKKSRGTFGEVQLSNLIRNVLPETNFKFQYTLSNGKRPDCLLLLPEPTGHVAVDAKFPLEYYRKIIDERLTTAEQKLAEQQFRQVIKKHIDDIASKYIVAEETAEGAVMFIPAEAVFAEIHSHYDDLVEYAHKMRVWLVSPTTMMAILTTARAVLKDAATRKQVHIIQEHLGHLAQDFGRFEKRMDNLAKHIEQANEDVKAVNVSARKITSRFGKIEQVELIEENQE